MSDGLTGICQFFRENAYVLLACFLSGMFLYLIGRIKGISVLACISYFFSLLCGGMVFLMILLYLADYKIRFIFDLFMMHKELVIFLVIDLALSLSFKKREERETK